MSCCCRSGQSNKSSVSCLGRCDLPKHRCLEKAAIKPGPVPRYMGWHYTARGAPEHQLRCGWRPGHIYCPVLRKIEMHKGMKASECTPCPSACPPYPSVCFAPPRCSPCPPYRCYPCPPKCLPCPSPCSPGKSPICSGQPYIRIVRHAGQYTICTKPSNVSNAPSGQYPLKYVLNTHDTDKVAVDGKVKYSIEAKFNDYQFDYTSSQASFVLDFTPPDGKCFRPCP